MTLLIIVLWLLFGVVTVALVSLAARYMESRQLDMSEIVLVLLFWPYFLLALIVRINGD
jgi:hypothetical protein